MHILIIHVGTTPDSLWATARAAAEFGPIHVAVPQDAGVGIVVPRNLQGLRLHFYPAVSLTDCTRAALSDGALPRPELVILGCAQGESCALLTDLHSAAAIVAQAGIPVMSAVVPVRPDGWLFVQSVQYAIERLLRNVLLPEPRPAMALHATIPNVYPNQLSGFCLGGTGSAYLDEVPVQIQALMSNVQAIELVRQRIDSIGSRHAYEEAGKAHDSANYHFKGALLAEPGQQRLTPPAGGGEKIESYEETMLGYAAGRTLDVGCGAGRIAVYLMERCAPPVQEVVGIDWTPTALQEYAERFREKELHPCVTFFGDILVEDWRSLGVFDTLLLCGNNLGIAQDFDSVVYLLQRLRSMAHVGSNLIGSTRHPLHVRTPADESAVSQRNVSLGFGAGERWLRLTYKSHDTGWIKWYYLSPSDLCEAARRSGWGLEQIFYADQRGEIIQTTNLNRCEVEAATDEYGAMMIAL